MIKCILLLITVMFAYNNYAQISGLNPDVSLGSPLFSQNSDGALSKIIREAGKVTQIYDGETLGSPYPLNDFTPAQIYYKNKYTGTYLVRYNAWRGQMEIKETNNPTEQYKIFLVDKNIHLMYAGHLMRFSTFIDDKNETKNAYLTTLIDNEKYTI